MRDYRTSLSAPPTQRPRDPRAQERGRTPREPTQPCRGSSMPILVLALVATLVQLGLVPLVLGVTVAAGVFLTVFMLVGY